MLTSPCADWPVSVDCSYGIPADPAQRTGVQRMAVSVATELLWRLTAGVFGVCEHTVRPCGVPGTVGGSYPVLADGQWLNVPCACRTSPCGCTVTSLRLPGPVQSVTAVVVDGQPLSADDYYVDNWAWLVRRQGAWPLATGAMSVTYRYGTPVPSGGQCAVAALAAEVVKACSGGVCKLPARTTQVSREGLTVTLDTADVLTAGRTGVPETDMWIGAVNPHSVRQRPGVWSVDLPQWRETTHPTAAPPGAPTLVNLVPTTTVVLATAGDTVRFRAVPSDPAAWEGGVWLAQLRDPDDLLVGEFTVTPDAGGVTLVLPAEVTAGLGGGWTGVWDAQVTTGSGTRTVLAGTLTLTGDVARQAAP